MLLSASQLQCLILDKQQVLPPDGWFVHGGLQLAPTRSLHQQQSLGRTHSFLLLAQMQIALTVLMFLSWSTFLHKWPRSLIQSSLLLLCGSPSVGGL